MNNKNKNYSWINFFLLALILLLGAYFRFNEIHWDENYHLHPDERFLTMVATSIQPEDNLKDYFNTDSSSLNPYNVVDGNGNKTYPFFVYGTFPLFLVRYIADWLNQTGYSQIHIVGRYLSGLFDLGSVVLVFLISKEIFKKKWIHLLAAFLYACAVLPIQISHFFIVDHFSTFFTILAIYFAVKLQNQRLANKESRQPGKFWNRILTEWKGFRYYAFFAIALGLAASSKINTVIAAGLLPMSVLIQNPRLMRKQNSQDMRIAIRDLLFAGIITFLIFRIFQPYAFTGPGFLDISLNPGWIRNLKELSYLSSGSSNYPPSLQWARRSFLFPIKNLVIWGMGIPMGLTALLGLFTMGWEIIKRKKWEFLVIWLWNLINLAWQMIRWNPTMRYLLPIYPTLAISSAYFIYFSFRFLKKKVKHKTTVSFISILLLGVVGSGTLLWGTAFSNMYMQPMTRIEASEWMYRNIEGAVNLIFRQGDEEVLQALPYPHQFILEEGKSLFIDFKPKTNGVVNKIIIDGLLFEATNFNADEIQVRVINKNSEEIITETNLSKAVINSSNSRYQSFVIQDFPPFDVTQMDEIGLTIENLSTTSLSFFGNISFNLIWGEQNYEQAVFEAAAAILPDESIEISFTPITGRVLEAVELFRIHEVNAPDTQSNMQIEVIDEKTRKRIGITSATPDSIGQIDFRGTNPVFHFDEPISLKNDSTYLLKMTNIGRNGNPVILNGSKIAKETDWDDALPLLMYGMNPHDVFQGIYQSDLNFQMYWDENTEKFSRFISTLDQSDYIVITSSRQWGSVTQIPERYPLSTRYYHKLIGCPFDDVQYCYEVGQPGMFQGDLGFRLVKTFQSNPRLSSLEINSQFAEEAFTVYDHPKVLIFEKQDDFDINRVIEMFGGVDLEEVINLSPEEADRHPGKLFLPWSILQEQRVSGTWSDLYNYESLQNKYPLATVIIWYVFISILGWIVYPMTRLIFKNIPHKGFYLVKPMGIIICTYPVWLLSSAGFDFSRLLILITLLAIIAGNLFIFLKSKDSICKEIKTKWKIFLWIELLSLFFFLFFLLIRLGNPDLWHPYKGGEKPMDFAYFNAVLKSNRFPPYDPWYAGGYINYYYFGFILAAIPTKLLGVVPSIAYNLILPTFFLYTAMSAYSIGITLLSKWNDKKGRHARNKSLKTGKFTTYILAMIFPVFVLIIGNLGTIRMIFEGFQKIGSVGSGQQADGILQQIQYLMNGIRLIFQGQRFNFYPGDWYWIPSRTIPGESITEFPFFTFLYGDPHAHLFAYPISLLALNWIINLLLFKEKKMDSGFFFSLLIGALIIGSLRPTNTWDYPTFLGLACLSILYFILKNVFNYSNQIRTSNIIFGNILKSILLVLAFSALSFILFLPFSKWYGQAYASIGVWKGDKTPIWSYLLHWGFFIFIIFTWLFVETKSWLADTPLSALEPFYNHRALIYGITAIVTILAACLYIWGVKVILLILPVLTLGALLTVRHDTSPIMRIVLIMMMVGFSLTLIVEVIVLKGDIGRMNTVFKFYLQAWTFIAISSGIFLIDFLKKREMSSWASRHNIWNYLFIFLLISVLLFPILGGLDKMTDRISMETPLTLDGMDFMRYSTYMENDYLMELGQDYVVIRWMQENIEGTPVIMEGNIPEYRWGNRYSVYTGLPTVIGWNWHQRQQRAINPGDWIFDRVADVSLFYNTIDLEQARKILKQYNVGYFIVGQLEHAVYEDSGLKKFNRSGNLWTPVFEYGDTVVYAVNQDVL